MENRRTFIKKLTAAGLLSALPTVLPAARPLAPKDKIWAALLHLSFNMWEDHDRFLSQPGANVNQRVRVYDPSLRLSEALWNEALQQMASKGLNMVVIDLGDAVQYESHPEIGVKNAWSTARLRQELAKMRKMGLEPIPKLNFSAGHDTWLGEYSRMVSTERYYAVCRSLIAEVISLFDRPRFFHLGYDEENAFNQRYNDLVVIRQHDLWWKDFYFFVNEVEKAGVRPWIWSDYVWENQEVFLKKMPKSVLQSNWFYKENFDKTRNDVKAYLLLEEHGYDQVPTAAYFELKNGEPNTDKNMLHTVQFSTQHIADARLLGFMQTLWRPTTEDHRKRILEGIELTGEARKWYRKHAHAERAKSIR